MSGYNPKNNSNATKTPEGKAEVLKIPTKGMGDAIEYMFSGHVGDDVISVYIDMGGASRENSEVAQQVLKNI